MEQVVARLSGDAALGKHHEHGALLRSFLREPQRFFRVELGIGDAAHRDRNRDAREIVAE